MAKKKKKTRQKAVYIIFSVLFLGMFAFAAFKLITIGASYAHNRRVQNDIQDLFFNTSLPAGYSGPEYSVGENSRNNYDMVSGFDHEESVDPYVDALPSYDFTPLLEVNRDIKGWLSISNVAINHPVAQSSDNEYYLYRNIYREFESAGTCFVDYRVDAQTCRNLVIYGHSMKDGSMMGKLRRYLKKDEGLAHPFFWYFTPDHVYRCDVFSTYLTTIEDDYLVFDFANDDEFMAYVKQIKKWSAYDFGVEVTPADRIITLSTCNYSIVKEDGRQALHAVMVQVK